MGRLFVSFEGTASGYGGVGAVNRVAARVLRESFPTVADPAEADLQVLLFGGSLPAGPRRLFLDHGSFADAGFWAYVAPALRTTDAILVSCRACIEVAERMLASPRPELRLVPLFADTGTFRPAEDRGALRRELVPRLAVPADASWLLAVSSFDRRKNLHLAVELLRALVDRLPDVHLLVVGSAEGDERGAYARSIDERAAELGIQDRVHRLGSLRHAALRDLMAASDLLVHLTTCRLENFGLVVAEALASGLPVVAADWGGLRDLVRGGETGVLAPTHLSRRGPRVDWRAAVEPAAELLADRARWSAVSAWASGFAAEALSVPSYTGRLRDAVSALLGERPVEDRPVTLSEHGQDVAFETYALYRRQPEIRSTGAEYRALLARRGGELCRILSGPAARSERPPAWTARTRLYPAVRYDVVGDRIDASSDPAWPFALDGAPLEAALARAVLDAPGGLTVEEAARARQQDEPTDVLVAAASGLVDEGLLCPLAAG